MANGHGGRRPGAGRKKGAATKFSTDIVERALKSGTTPLEYMLRVLRNPKTPQARRDAMATAAAPYLHPRLQAVEHKGDGGGLTVNLLQLTPGQAPRMVQVSTPAKQLSKK